MDRSWLDKKLTISEAEAGNRHNGVAFGLMNAQWEQLKSEMIDGGELWSFNSPADSWRHLAGRWGIALVRNGEVIKSLVTMMN